MKVTTAVMIFLLPISTGNVQASVADSTIPALVSIESDKTSLAPGEKITFSVGIEDESDLDYVYLKVNPIHRSILGTSVQLKFDAATEKYVGSYTVPTSAFNEQWYVSFVGARDVHGNYMHLEDGGIVINNWESPITFKIFDGNDTVGPTFEQKGSLTLNVTGPFDFTKNLVIYDDVDTDVEKSVKVTHNIPEKTVGTFTVNYEAKDFTGNLSTFSQDVTIKDIESPKLYNVQNRTIFAGDAFYALEGIQATDNFEGDVSNAVKYIGYVDTSKAGDYSITYRVSDKAGNTINQTAKITVVAKESVTITGTEDEFLLLNSTFDPLAGVKVMDSSNQDVTANLSVESSVETDVAGRYSVIYTFDQGGYEPLTVYRQITVAPYNSPRIEGLQDLYLFEGEALTMPTNIKAYNVMGLQIDGVQMKTDRPVKDAGDYAVTYSVKDHYGYSYEETKKLTVLAKEASFSDVPVSHRYFKEIQFMKEMGIINGYPDKTFNPTASISRQHVASLIYRSGVALKPIREKIAFVDVPESHPYYTEIMALYQAGIIDGVNGMFNPKNSLTRAQLAKILVNAYKLELQPLNLMTFTDTDNHWAKDYINILSSNGITTGAQGRFNPNEQVSRMHYATFMYRIVQ
ncbi:S-layer homology domain-containing protein [Ureibacillus xyleni]|nr:S-layer homology domain-containing protein [Ureibacillus xyleni]